MFSDFTDDLERLESRSREFECNGRKFILTCSDPYGFWSIKCKGANKTPDILLGQYTTYDDAVRTCKIYAEKSPAPEEKNLEDHAPPIKYKKPRVTDKV